MPRVGKTTFGKMIAQMMGYEFIDTDRCIEKSYHEKQGIALQCPEIFHTHGEKYFRSLEKETTLSINPQKPTVIATGGGTLMIPQCRDHLRNIGNFIYLRASYEYLRKKILSAHKLPTYLSGNFPEETLKNLYRIRTEIFEKEAKTICDIEQIFNDHKHGI